MTTFITGGSKCGKSRLAETILSGFPGTKLYIATMQPDGAEAEKIIARHKQQRAGKGFQTVERYTDLAGLAVPEGCGILLECLGNLCANELFGGSGCPEQTIPAGLEHLRSLAEVLVIVSPEISSGGTDYPPETCHYLRSMGHIHQFAAAMADTVIECVYGIPVVHKGVFPC